MAEIEILIGSLRPTTAAHARAAGKGITFAHHNTLAEKVAAGEAQHTQIDAPKHSSLSDNARPTTVLSTVTESPHSVRASSPLRARPATSAVSSLVVFTLCVRVFIIIFH